MQWSLAWCERATIIETENVPTNQRQLHSSQPAHHQHVVYMGLAVTLLHHHHPLPHQYWAHCSPSGFHAILATGLTWPSLATGSLIATMTTTMMVMICEWGDKHGVGVDEYWWWWWWQLYRWERWTRKPEEINGLGARFLTICCFIPLVEIILSKITFNQNVENESIVHIHWLYITQITLASPMS